MHRKNITENMRYSARIREPFFRTPLGLGNQLSGDSTVVFL